MFIDVCEVLDTDLQSHVPIKESKSSVPAGAVGFSISYGCFSVGFHSSFEIPLHFISTNIVALFQPK